MAKKPVRTPRARASDPAAIEHPILTLREQVERAVAADQQARAEADRARELATFRGWPERVAARRSELLLAAPVDPADALCVLERFDALLQELCFQRELLAHVRLAARELDAPADERERAELAFAALLSLLEYQLYELLDAAVGHADAAGVDAAALSEAVRSPTREAVGRAGDAIRVALSRERGGRAPGGGSADAGEFRPATWFPKGMADRLRQAASRGRKTKRVATRVVDGVVCYSVTDARRWWPSDVPKEA